MTGRAGTPVPGVLPVAPAVAAAGLAALPVPGVHTPERVELLALRGPLELVGLGVAGTLEPVEPPPRLPAVVMPGRAGRIRQRRSVRFGSRRPR